jgi:hypothetical protein
VPRYRVDLDGPKLTKRKLFHVAAESQHTFFVGGHQRDWSRYAVGYKNAADMIAARLVKLDRVTEAACLPALFLYRHYVELSLKGMLLDAGELLNQDELAPKDHSLTPLWLLLRRRIGKIQATNSEDWLDRAEVLIREFDQLDRSSFTFRYPVNKSGVPNLPFSHKVDIKHFRDVMDELEMVMDGIGGWLDANVETKRDMEAEFGGW